MLQDLHPKTPIAALRRDFTTRELREEFQVDLVAALVGMSPSYVSKVLGRRATQVTLQETLALLDQDSFGETFVPRSRIPAYLLSRQADTSAEKRIAVEQDHVLIRGNAADLLPQLAPESVPCVVTSTPYWGMRLYDDAFTHRWADGEDCPFGNEQTPDAFVRHTIEILFLLRPALTSNASVWWNLMDTYNTRTQIRGSASETLNAMRGNDPRGWGEHACRRYSAGHSYLKDGEQCVIPSLVASRASRIGYFLKSTIAWKKNGSMPETVETRVTREMEYILHLSTDRAPFFNKEAFLETAESLGGRNKTYESEKVTDVWHFSTASGRDGHGAQFPVALAGRCIVLSARPGDRILDPFMGSGTTSVAALQLDRLSVGFDVSETYIDVAQKRIKATQPTLPFNRGASVSAGTAKVR